MNLSHAGLIEFLKSLSWANLFWYAVVGVMVGAGLGLALTWVLQSRNWLKRSNRLHHWMLKLYFAALPLFGGLVGLQAGGDLWRGA